MRRLAPLFVVPLLALGGCGDAEPASEETSPTTSPSTSTPTSTPSEATPSPTDMASPTGSASQPSKPVTDLLSWTPLPGKVYDTVTTNGDQTLTVAEMGDTASLDGARLTPGSSYSAASPIGMAAPCVIARVSAGRRTGRHWLSRSIAGISAFTAK